MNNFKEEDHPRDSDGKFSSNAGNGSSDNIKEKIAWARSNGKELPLNKDSSLNEIALQKMYSERNMEYSNLPSANRLANSIPQGAWKNHDAPSPRGKNKSREEFFGEEFKGYKGSSAVEKLLKEQHGHIKNAFERPEIGGIDLVWGDESGGLLHTIQERDKLLKSGIGHISGLDMVKKIPEIVEKGIVKSDEKFRPCIEYDGYRVAIKPTFDGQKINWLISAMEIL